MNIVLNFIGIRVGGGKTDAEHLIETMPVIAPHHNYLVIVPFGCGYEKMNYPGNCKVKYEKIRKLNNVWRLYFDNVALRRICKAFDADVLFTMCNIGPLSMTCCRHVLMLRLSYFAYPLKEYEAAKNCSLCELAKTVFLKRMFRFSAANADALIVQTNTMRSRLLGCCGNKTPVHVIGKNVSSAMVSERMKGGSAKYARIYSHNSKMKLLCPAKYYAHKNVERACEAVASLRGRDHDVVLFLMIERDDHPKAFALISAIESGVFGDAVVNLGYSDFSDMGELYRCCDAVLMPSLLESFSAIFLEAMLHGKPIVTSEREFAREICGDAALYFEPKETMSIAAAIEKLLSDEHLYKTMVDAGRVQYSRYDMSWENISRMYLDVLTDVVSPEK